MIEKKELIDLDDLEENQNSVINIWKLTHLTFWHP